MQMAHSRETLLQQLELNPPDTSLLLVQRSSKISAGTCVSHQGKPDISFCERGEFLSTSKAKNEDKRPITYDLRK